jgi:hypothetical protein
MMALLVLIGHEEPAAAVGLQNSIMNISSPSQMAGASAV